MLCSVVGAFKRYSAVGTGMRCSAVGAVIRHSALERVMWCSAVQTVRRCSAVGRVKRCSAVRAVRWCSAGTQFIIFRNAIAPTVFFQKLDSHMKVPLTQVQICQASRSV